MSSYDLLDAKEEEELFKGRLLNVEEKPFKRITKRLATLHTVASSRTRQAPTPPPEDNRRRDSSSAAAASSTTPTGEPVELTQLREDVTLDFAAFDSAIQRLQFLFSANERERARYTDDRVSILNKCQSVRENTATLREHLEQAQATLEQRKKFDELADKITSNRLLRPRADQQANLQKLADECKQLEEERETYAETWRERKDQFSRIMDESMRLRRLIRDEKEEVERREGMADEGAEGGAADGPEDGHGGGGGGHTPRPSGMASGHATPHPESGMIPKVTAGLETAGTPRPTSFLGSQTPARESPGPDGDDGLKPHAAAGPSSFSRSGSRAPSREASPRRTRQDEPEEGEDVEMDDTQAGETPRITVDSQDTTEERMDMT